MLFELLPSTRLKGSVVKMKDDGATVVYLQGEIETKAERNTSAPEFEFAAF